MNNLSAIDILGFFGAACTLIAFFNVTHGRWQGQSMRYQLTNLVAGLSLAVYAWQKHAIANVVLNVVWCAVGCYGLLVVLRLRSKRLAPQRRKA